ncbi:MAG TPA: hypothetical protein VFO89_09145, partial [Thermoanaerobaculia bacterium]|nr:hypothetical protein [Thermoanaerobaculia bacterium]
MSDASRAVLILRRRLALALFARYALLYAAAAFLACGVALLLLKRSSVIPPAWPFALALGLAVILAAIHARRRMPSRAATIALLDARSHAGGLLMAGDAVPLGAWTPAVDAIPRVSWRARRQVALTAVCAAFLAVAAVVPAPARTTRHALAIEADVEKLAERIELLK